MEEETKKVVDNKPIFSILFVEDSELIRKQIRKCLENISPNEMSVVACENYEDAETKVIGTSHNFDLFVCDIAIWKSPNNPGEYEISGIRLMREFRKNNSHSPIIIYSQMNRNVFQNIISELGAEFVSKYNREDNLINKVKQIINQKSKL